MKCKKCGSINLGIRKNFKKDMEENEGNKINKQLQFYQELLTINKDCNTCDYNITEDDIPFVNCTSNIECINKNMWKLKTLK